MPKPNQKEKNKSSEKPPEETPECEEEGATAAATLSNILKELKEFRTETTGNLAAIKKDIGEIKKDVSDLRARVNAAEERIAENESRDIQMTKVLFHVLRTQKQLEEKCQDLESRSRRKNLRIYMIPERLEGSDMVNFISKLLNEKLGIMGVKIERAHRVSANGGGRPGSTRPRSVLVRFQSYWERQRVLSAAWSKKEIRLNDTRIFFDEDFTPQVYAERAKYISVRKEMRARNIKSRILYPAKLKVFGANGHVKVFDTPQAAAEGLKEFGITMDYQTKEEPNFETLLKASGWQSPRRRSGRANDLTSCLKTLLSSMAHLNATEDE
ncbi:hypothetical protein WMY93_004558 [Mugilogobius chulae]|uniref:L1 transposable element RRM domain-containing protein n=2 Tax=Mugilogobius chulae TaxID=88201 RepID=A0AAW0PIN8_9GOBI